MPLHLAELCLKIRDHPGVGAVRTDALAFGEFRLDRANALLWRGGERIALAPKPFEVLCYLVCYGSHPNQEDFGVAHPGGGGDVSSDGPP